jgi:hypothetical protein
LNVCLHEYERNAKAFQHSPRSFASAAKTILVGDRDIETVHHYRGKAGVRSTTPPAAGVTIDGVSGIDSTGEAGNGRTIDPTLIRLGQDAYLDNVEAAPNMPNVLELSEIPQ